MKFLRDACRQEIPPEIVPGMIGQRIFHKPGPDKFEWEAEIVSETTIMYSGELMGPAGAGKVVAERGRWQKAFFWEPAGKFRNGIRLSGFSYGEKEKSEIPGKTKGPARNGT